MNIRYFLKATIAFIIILLFQMQLISQTNSKNLNYAKHPYWVEMMNDPNVNYFEAVKAYTEFWANRKKPKEEDDIIGQSKVANEKEESHRKWFKTRKEREEMETQKYAFDCKKFEHWMLIIKPYVQEDGRILNADQQLEIWKQQRQK